MNKHTLTHFLTLPELGGSKKVCFQGAAYPLLFFTHYFTQLKKQGVHVQYFDTQTASYADAVSRFEMSILGETCIYWLKDLSVLSDAARAKYITYIQQYQGPHTLCFFIEQPIDFADDTLVVTIPETVQEADYRALALPVMAADAFTKALFAQHASIPFEKALLLIQYQLFLGRTFQPFIQQWLPRIIISEHSLFILSQSFFARNYAQFLKDWALVKMQYPDEFWLAFWSEQLWQALIFIGYAKKGEAALARSKVFRLPFSFMNKDWKNIDEQELINAHQFLYNVDYGMKNGRAVDGVDLFVHKFALRSFK